jgi:hypothetical protein
MFDPLIKVGKLKSPPKEKKENDASYSSNS